MSNEIITLVKDTSLARVVALQEVIWMGESFMKGNQGYAGLVWPLFFTAVYYLVFSGGAAPGNSGNGAGSSCRSRKSR